MFYYEQVGYAIADSLMGPYTKFAGNPFLAWGPPGSFDAGTIADPWVVEFHGTYYIGYTVSSSIYSPWQTAIASTTDWQTFTKLGVTFPLGPAGAWDAVNAFRGAVTRINDTYLLSYTGDGYQMGIATQPVYQQMAINDPYAVFGFFDGFDGASLDTSKWRFDNGASSQASFSGGELTLTATGSTYVKISSLTTFGMDTLVETSARHPQAGQDQLIAEIGWTGATFDDTARMADDFHNTANWERQAKTSATPGDPWTTMGVPADPGQHKFQIYRVSPNTAGFQIEGFPVETTNDTVPTNQLSPFLMSYGSGNQMIVDWIRVRNFCGAEAVSSVGSEEPRPLEGRIAIDKSGDTQILSGATANFNITVSNIGDYDLSNVVVTDPLVPDCERTIGSLPLGASTSFTCSLLNVTADLTNVASVTGETPASVQVSASDSHTVDVLGPGITVDLAPNSQSVFTGRDAAFQVTVTNSGDLALSDVSVTSAETPDCSRTIGVLLSGNSTSYTCSMTNVTADFTTNVSASGQPPLGPPISASDSALVMVRTVEGAAWFDPNWRYRRPVLVSNPCGQATSDYQVQISLDSSFDFTKTKPDGSDLRVTSDDGTTQVPFWIERWDVTAQQASIWVKLAQIPLSGTAVFLYYGNPNPPGPPIVETPPTGPWTRAPGNPIVPAGGLPNGQGLLAENIVYDNLTAHYWMVHANYNDGGVGLVWSDTPTDPASWHWSGSVIPQANAPHILQSNNKWYIVFSDWTTPSTTTRHPIQIMEAASIAGPYSNRTTLLSPEPGTWENWRVDEPYLFQRNDGKWILVYMGDQGDFEHGVFYYEQVGYAIADSLMGPYTKFAGNPFLAWGPPGSFDAGTIADPWVVEFHGTYYIGYTVSSSIYSPWQTAIASTTDWQTFTKLGVTFPLGPAGAWDAVNAFRGAVTRINDTYLLSYTGDGYQMGIATQPVYQQQPFNQPGLIYPFFDDFNDGAFDTSKWLIDSGNSGQLSESGGTLTLTSNGEALGQFVKIYGQSSFGMNTMVEIRARHPQAGQNLMISEAGLMGAGFSVDKVRLADDFHNLIYWERQAALSSTLNDPWTNTAVPVDTDWHTLRIYRVGPNVAGFQIDGNPVETTTTTVPTSDLPAFLMSFGTGNQLIVDWVRVRSFCGAEAGIQILAEQFHNDAPIAENDSYTTQQGQTLNRAEPGVLANDSDPDLDTITAVLVSAPAHGNLTLNPNGSFTYIPNSGFSGADSFTYKANDGLADSNTATVSLTVTPAEPTCVTIQRGALGVVEDSYIWYSLPTSSYTTAPTLYTGVRTHATRGPGETRLLLRFGLEAIPQGALVQSATLGITLFSTNPSQSIGLYRITAPWSEAGGTTWNALNGAYDPTAQGSFTAQTGPVSADLTGLVSAWVNGTSPNDGVMLINTSGQLANTYRGSEYATLSQRPWLRVCYLTTLGPATAIEVSPAIYSVPAGANVTYQATARDAAGHTWDVTGAAQFSIQSGAGGAWNGGVYTSQNLGTWTVTATFEGLTDTAELTVEAHGPATSIDVAPNPAAITAGESVTYQVTASDAYGNTWDVTAGSSFSIPPGAGGAWNNNIYTSAAAGVWTVTASYNSLSDTATLTVNHGPAVTLRVEPAAATIQAGTNKTYQALGVDAQGNTWDVTSSTTFEIETGAGGAWNGSVYTSQNTGTWTVTGTYTGLTGTASLGVIPSTEPTCVTIQRGASGVVEDSYIWYSLPTSSYTTAPTLYTGVRTHATRGPGETRLLLRFGLEAIPQGALVQSATLGITLFSTNPSQSIGLYRITAPWSEAGGTTWNALNGAYDPTAQGSFTAQTGPVSTDLTGLVSAWVNGASPNNGVMLINTSGQLANTYRGSETATLSQRPWLRVCYLPPQ